LRVLLVPQAATFIDEHVGILEAAASSPAVVDVALLRLGQCLRALRHDQSQAIGRGQGSSPSSTSALQDQHQHHERLRLLFHPEFYKAGDDPPTPSPRSSPSRSRKPRLSSGTRGARSRRCRTASRASWRTSATTSTFRSITSRPVRQEGRRGLHHRRRLEHVGPPGDPRAHGAEAGPEVESPPVPGARASPRFPAGT